MIPAISLKEVRNLVNSKGKKKYVLIDVREKEEMQHGMIPTAINIPMSELTEAFDLSDRDFNDRYGIKKPHKKDLIITYCRIGGRSQQATEGFIDRGYKAKNFYGSIWEWSDIDSNVKKYGPAP